ncbi:hypothetical protein [Rhodococcus sp. W8901]|uniref:hypothetical protein n=1 Tax=Rhodococcus sp. W8901 TaxID=2742603 RepID=UPI001582A64F|nr:hypothetical protein [Rhodococcus sp. W8901]QKT09704.1 hypothetical protein HUN07_02250 [Rhodococcus sp. W8901]
MTSGGQDPNQNPEGGNNEPQQGGTPPPPGSYPPPPGATPPPPGPGGGYPPPPGSYPPPPGPGGGYPPPPGNFPPPPPAFDAGYGQLQHVDGLSVGAAISYGWRKFAGNAGIWVLIMLIAAVIQAVLGMIFDRSPEVAADGTIDWSPMFSLWGIIGLIVTTVVGYLIQAAMIGGALHETSGTKPSIGSFFQFANVGAVVLASFLVGLLSAVGFILLVIPGIIVVFLTWWTLQFVIDQNQDAVTAIKSSFRAISSNWGPLLLLALALVGLNILGAIPLGLGLFITIPMTIIASTYAYRVTVGGRVAP